MMRRLDLCFRWLTVGILAAGCSDDPATVGNKPPPDPPPVGSDQHPLGSEISVSWEVLDNHKDPGGAKFASQLTLENGGTVGLGKSGWSLYFNFVRDVFPESLPAGITVTHINGDFFKFEPTPAFVPVEPGKNLVIPFDAANWGIKVTDAPAGYYFVFTDSKGNLSEPQVVGKETVLPLLDEKQTDRFVGDNTPVPTSESRYADNTALTVGEPGVAGLIVPSPTLVQPATIAGKATLTKDVGIYYAAGLEKEASSLAAALEPLLGGAPAIHVGAAPLDTVAISLTTGAITVDGQAKAAGDEAYTLTVTAATGISIVGSDAGGVFYGIQSLRALAPIAAYQSAQTSFDIDAVVVADAPRFKYRGMHLDVARNFQGKDAVKKLIDLMSFYKLNKLHLHLTDDEGWRLAIDGLPELTEVGSRRGHTAGDEANIVPSFGSGPDPAAAASHGNGFFTRADFLEILKFATARHVEVIPEIDMPGHARAAIKAMNARYTKLVAAGDEAGAKEFLLSEAEDKSKYRSVQMWTDNVVNPCQDSTYAFLKKVVDDVRAMYTEAEAPLTTVHTGGDEVPAGVWVDSPACTSLINKAAGDGIESTSDLPQYFLKKYSDILGSHELVTAGWEEIALHKVKVGETTTKEANPAFLESKFQPYAWNNVWGWGDEGNTYKLANAGYPVILSNATNLYFDLAYDKDPDEPGYYWAGFVDTRTVYEFVPLDLYKSAHLDRMGNPIDRAVLFATSARLEEAGKPNILGIQGQLWGENAKGPELMEYLAFPKMIALSERAWAKISDWETEEDDAARDAKFDAAWKGFAHSLGERELPRLDHLSGGVKYRIPLPGAKIEGGQLSANVAYPGLTIRYTTDGSEPSATSTEYTAPVAVTGVVKLKTFDTLGRGSRTAVVK